MEAISRRARAAVLVLLGVVGGSTVTGCALIWMAAARADGAGSVDVVACDPKTHFAKLDLPGMSANDIATSVRVIVSDSSFPGVTGGVVPFLVGDGIAVATGCDGSVTFLH